MPPKTSNTSSLALSTLVEHTIAEFQRSGFTRSQFGNARQTQMALAQLGATSRQLRNITRSFAKEHPPSIDQVISGIRESVTPQHPHVLRILDIIGNTVREKANPRWPGWVTFAVQETTRAPHREIGGQVQSQTIQRLVQEHPSVVGAMQLKIPINLSRRQTYYLYVYIGQLFQTNMECHFILTTRNENDKKKIWLHPNDLVSLSAHGLLSDKKAAELTREDLKAIRIAFVAWNHLGNIAIERPRGAAIGRMSGSKNQPERLLYRYPFSFLRLSQDLYVEDPQMSALLTAF